MDLIKHNSLKSDMFFNPIFIPGFSGSGSRVRIQVLEAAPIFSKFDQTKMRQILMYTLSNLFDSVNFVKLI